MPLRELVFTGSHFFLEVNKMDLFSEEYLAHYGIKGQKWGERNYQYEDGSLTPAGRERYRVGDGHRPKNYYGDAASVEGMTEVRQRNRDYRESFKAGLKTAGKVAGVGLLVSAGAAAASGLAWSLPVSGAAAWTIEAGAQVAAAVLAGATPAVAALAGSVTRDRYLDARGYDVSDQYGPTSTTRIRVVRR